MHQFVQSGTVDDIAPVRTEQTKLHQIKGLVKTLPTSMVSSVTSLPEGSGQYSTSQGLDQNNQIGKHLTQIKTGSKPVRRRIQLK